MARFTLKDLHHRIRKIDQKPYGQYRMIQGDWWGENICYRVLHAQGDPYANPSRLEVRAPLADMGIDAKWIKLESQKIALADFLHREAWKVLQEWPEEIKDSFKMTKPNSAILLRTACFVEHASLVLRLAVQLPGPERRIDGELANHLLTMRLPEILAALHVDFVDQAALALHQQVYERHLQIRNFLSENNLVAFIADGSILPRDSGYGEAPLATAIPFSSPENLRVEFKDVQGTLTGMGIPKGLTVITGGAFHGKSTLLQSLEAGIYPRIPGDGREFIVTEPSAWKLKVEDGRPICGTDLSPILGQLPGGSDSAHFFTTNASGSTSQAANLVEAWEVGSRLFLIDEDQSAVNFLFKDARMRALVPDELDPIRHLSSCVGELCAQGLSLILCQGASGDFLEEAQLVLRMNRFNVEDITELRNQVLGQGKTENGLDGLGFAPQAMNLPVWPQGLAGKSLKSKVRGKSLFLGDLEVRAEGLVQLACNEQLKAIGELLLPWIQSGHPVAHTNPEWATKKIWDRLRANSGADLALPRPQEIWAVLRRIPGLQFAKAQ